MNFQALIFKSKYFYYSLMILGKIVLVAFGLVSLYLSFKYIKSKRQIDKKVDGFVVHVFLFLICFLLFLKYQFLNYFHAESSWFVTVVQVFGFVFSIYLIKQAVIAWIIERKTKGILFAFAGTLSVAVTLLAFLR